MTEKEVLINFLNLNKPTVNQIIKIIKILIKHELKITDDGFEINSLTGQKDKKISTAPTQIDLVTDESIMINIAKMEAEKVKTDISATLSTAVKGEVTKQLTDNTVVVQPKIDKLKLDNKLL